MSNVFRFAGVKDWPNAGGSTNLRKKRSRTRPEAIPLGADIEYIANGSGLHPIESYQDIVGRRAITLTQREADLIALRNPGAPPPVSVEVLHPWLSRQKYVPDARRNYSRLAALLRRYGSHFFEVGEFCDHTWNSVCNALRRTNDLDARFYHAWHLPLQDVYLLEESRPDRRVVAFDFNSMYAACMQQQFPLPSKLKRVSLERLLRENEELPIGLFRCTLGGPSAFIRKHNPFRRFFSGRYLGCNIEEGVQVDLSEFEVEFYRRHFSSVYLHDAVVSERSVPHPLAREVRRSHARRINYLAQSNNVLAAREKFRMTLMASCTSRPREVTRTFQALEDALAHLAKSFGFEPHLDEPMAAVLAWLSGAKGVSLQRLRGRVRTSAPALHDGSSCFSLGQRIVSRARTMLLEYMEKLTTYSPDLELCYCNIDSIHFSVPASQVDGALSLLRERTSSDMGDLRIEAISRHGLWLEPGRYWLYDDAVSKFSNSGIGDGVQPFKEKRIGVSTRKIDGLHVPVRLSVSLANSMSDIHGLRWDSVAGLFRQRSAEVTAGMAYGDVLEMLEGNRREAIPVKLQAFQLLKQRLHPEA